MQDTNSSNSKWQLQKDIFPDMREEFANPETEHTASPKAPKQKTNRPPAMAFQFGRILTRVWANPTHWGDIDWRVDQSRNTHPGTGAFARNFCPQDLEDARRGLFAAQRWIKRAERSRRRRWFW